jgi:hypothetical protein
MLLSHELYLVDKQSKGFYVEPLDSAVHKMNQDLRNWVNMVSIKSPLTQALLMCRDEAYDMMKTLHDLVICGTEQYACREQRYDIPAIVKQTQEQARRAVHGIDQLLHDIAGVKYDSVNWQNIGRCHLMKSDQFARLLYDYMGSFLKLMECVDIERDYPWLVRYTDNVFRDAPSQCSVYYSLMEKYMDRTKELKRSEVAAAHERFQPYHPYLVIDIAPEHSQADMAVKSMIEWENRTIKSSSAATSKESRKSDSPPKEGMKSVMKSKSVKTPEYFNPVVSQQQSNQFLQSSGWIYHWGAIQRL